MTALVQAFAARLGAAWSGGSLMTLMTEGVSVFFSSLVALMMGLPLCSASSRSSALPTRR